MDVLDAGAAPWAPEATSVGDLLDPIESPPWHRDALCREHPEINWFPPPIVPRAAAPALTICGRCLVVRDCREWALAQPVTLQGVWGGMSDQGRRHLLRTVTVSGRCDNCGVMSSSLRDGRCPGCA